MLQSLWLRLTSSGPKSSEDWALARYYRDEGLHAELALHVARDVDNQFKRDGALYAAHSYFAS
jgi:hypothetical protein